MRRHTTLNRPRTCHSRAVALGALVVAATLVWGAAAHAQTVEPVSLWAQRFGGGDFDIGRGVAVDGAGNVLVTGDFRGTADFGEFSLTSAGGDDAFVVELDPDGNVLWVRLAHEPDRRFLAPIST